jgi:hypothetical protein
LRFESWFLYDRVSCGDGKSTTSWEEDAEDADEKFAGRDAACRETPVVGGKFEERSKPNTAKPH